MTKDEYDAFYAALVSAESATVHDFDNTKFFEGCLPIEVMAHRGEGTLRFGPMKPVGLKDPRTGRLPYAVVQLRQDTLAGDHYSLVGFQTQIKWGDQARVLEMIPGLENAEFVRYGMVHRNTYICGPKVLLPTWQTKHRADLLFAGQVSGVEGYVESAASGLIAGRNAAAIAKGETPQAPPRTTAIGSLAYYVSHADPKTYQPTNITHGIMPPLDETPRDKMKKKLMIAERALADLDRWQPVAPLVADATDRRARHCRVADARRRACRADARAGSLRRHRHRDHRRGHRAGGRAVAVAGAGLRRLRCGRRRSCPAWAAGPSASASRDRQEHRTAREHHASRLRPRCCGSDSAAWRRPRRRRWPRLRKLGRANDGGRSPGAGSRRRDRGGGIEAVRSEPAGRDRQGR